MTITIPLYWAGPEDAESGSTYKIERNQDGTNWSTLAAGQAATTPYVSVKDTLSSEHTYGDSTISLTSASSFSSSGWGWLDDALVQWTGKSGNSLTGVTWHSGYGTYSSGTTLYEAHESYSDSTASVTLNAILYRITHITSGGVSSPPTYLWYYSPPVPESSNHCVLVVQLMSDLGMEFQSGQSVLVALLKDTEFTAESGAHLDASASSVRQVNTNLFGLAFFQLWKTIARNPLLSTTSGYQVTLNAGTSSPLVVNIATVPDQDFVFLHQVVTSLS